MICTGLLKELKNIEIEPIEKIYKNFDGTCNKTKGVVNLRFKYRGKNILEKFNVVENKKDKTILISNNLVKNIEAEKRKMPIKCKIDTEGKGPVSWTRPIRSERDKNDFEKLVNDLEVKGIIEPSKSNWLNPVVLTRKKSGELRFCLDLRRLNDLVVQDEFEIPKIGELLNLLYNKKYFTLIDLKDGFFQIEIEEKDKEKHHFYRKEANAIYKNAAGI